MVVDARAKGKEISLGLRINPELPLGETAKYDPSQPCSRLGFPISQLTAEHLQGIDGLHVHNLCEQDVEPFKAVWEKLDKLLTPHYNQLKWLNFGGGHHITRADYQRDELVALLTHITAKTGCEIYLEPGEAVALDAGILVGEILDIFHNAIPVGICDISATCHMPDVIEAPYRPAMLNELPEDSSQTPMRLGAQLPCGRHYRRLSPAQSSRA